MQLSKLMKDNLEKAEEQELTSSNNLLLQVGNALKSLPADKVAKSSEVGKNKKSSIDFSITDDKGNSVIAVVDGLFRTKNQNTEQKESIDFCISDGFESPFAVINGIPYFKNFKFLKNDFFDFAVVGNDGKVVFGIKDGILKTKNGVDSPFVNCKNYGKSVGVFGGSLSVYPESETAKNLWRSMLKMDVKSYGVGGAGFSSLQGTSLQQQVDGAESKDVYILWASTNDYTNSREIGTYKDYTYLDNYDESKRVTQCGGINYCIKKLYEKNPLCEVYFFTGIDFFSSESGYNPFSEQTNSLGYTYQQYVDSQKKCCELFSIPVLDQNAACGLNKFNYTNYFKSDNLHMTNEGYKKVGYAQVEFLKNGI